GGCSGWVIDRNSDEDAERVVEVEPALIPLHDRSVVQLEQTQQPVSRVELDADDGLETLARQMCAARVAPVAVGVCEVFDARFQLAVQPERADRNATSGRQRRS